MFPKLFLSLTLFQLVLSDFTFRNVIVTCDAENPLDDEIPFGTILTANRLKPHLPSDQKCDKIEIQYANIPVLSKNSLSEITNVKNLLLENNHIEHIEPGAFDGSKIKEILSLKSNQLREIRRGVFNDVQVPVLILSHNSISYIDFQAFDNMTLLESVHLDHNLLSRINVFWFRNTPNLSKLNLHHNRIEEIPANAFRNLVKKSTISRIDLSHNLITRVDGEAFGRVKKLHFLSLANNRLIDLDRNWLKGIKVDVLDVSGNRFRCLSYGLAEPFGTNYIDRNPWSCACLEDVKKKEFGLFGKIVAEESFRRCNIAYSP